MRKLLLIVFVLVVSLYAQNPKVYQKLGDVIYDDMIKISNLADTKAMNSYAQSIDKYLNACMTLKEEGLALDRDGGDEKVYLNKLRKLANEYDFFLRAAHTSLHQTMAYNDYAAFSELMETGLIDIEKDTDQIIAFYEKHRIQVNEIPEIESYIAYRDEIKKQDANALAERRAIYDRYKQRRVDQINRRQAKKKAAFAKEVEEERARTKEEVYKEQKEELKINR